MPHGRIPWPTRRHRLTLGVWFVAAALLPAPVLPQSELVIHKTGTKLYHRAGCPELGDSADVLAMTRAQAEARGYKPHDVCDPANPDRPATGKPERPPTVYLDGSRYYHRSTCSRLPEDKKKLKTASLEVAGKSHWPCPTCKPPVRKRSAEPAVPGTGRRGR